MSFASVRAPPDLGETALLLEWETQWRQTALNNQAADRGATDATEWEGRATTTGEKRERATRLSTENGGTLHQTAGD